MEQVKIYLLKEIISFKKYYSGIKMNEICIPESADVNILKAIVDINFKGKETRFAPAINLLVHVLFNMYGTVSVTMLKMKENNLDEPYLFSQAILKVSEECGWKNTTTSANVGYLKKLLRHTSIKESFINRITFSTGKQKEKYINERWVELIRKNTRIKSQLTIQRMCKFLDTLEKTVSNDIHMSDTVVLDICGKCDQKRGWLEFYMRYVLERPDIIVGKNKKQFSMTEEVGDKHRIPREELEKLQISSKKEARGELLFMLMISTGMRVGGLVRIKTEHVMTTKDNVITVKNMGKTLEKGSKWFSFIISDKCKELIRTWYQNYRPAVQSPYLFPSTKKGNEHITTCSVYAIFKRICRDACLTGSHLHPHALRHSYAHILLESGNSLEIISKMLGHSSVNITQNFYLKENAEEIVKRANIPWLKRENTKSSVPDFLTTENQEQHIPERRKRGMLKIVQFVKEQSSS